MGRPKKLRQAYIYSFSSTVQREMYQNSWRWGNPLYLQMEAGEEKMNHHLPSKISLPLHYHHSQFCKRFSSEIFNIQLNGRIELGVHSYLLSKLLCFQASISFLGCGKPDSFLFRQRYHCLIPLPNDEHVGHSRCKRVSNGILDVDDVE